MQFLVEKYLAARGSKLYAAFVDFKAAFDSIPRLRLREKFAASSRDHRLLLLMVSVYSNSGIRMNIRCSSKGHLTQPILVNKGVRQGCILAPLSFNFYINSLITSFDDLALHPPKFANRHVPVLAYSDDVLILSRTHVGMRRALRHLAQISSQEELTINSEKTKVLVFMGNPLNRSK